MTVLWWMVISSSGGIGRAGKVGGSDVCDGGVALYGAFSWQRY